MKWLLGFLLALLLVPAFGQYGKPVTAAEETKNLKLLLGKQAATKATYLKHPKDAAAKQKYVDANVALGLQYTYANTVDRKIKYKRALTYFREAKKVDPQNPTANKWINQIESIYRSMHRPIPG